ncbi:MAG: hypothetical protein D9N11_11990 [Ketobacter sp.]|nr:MAG: hypothetical protein D9N11_11990 [Ketobacter sp.]
MSSFEDPNQALLRSPVYGIVTGHFLGLNPSRSPLVIFPGQVGSAAKEARTIADLQNVSFGAEVILQFDQGDVEKPIILGVIQNPENWITRLDGNPIQVEADGKHMEIQAQEKLELRCGKASIILTSAGKVLIKGTYLSSRATGTHRIKGGCVQIN